uniref:Uncharacterized protein n=1 Tax=Hydrodictyon reticulatum TaxID=3107 RepID=A0A1W5RN02_HYDRE|nr:hypothetical protein [Hydrodictyon reticulatum]AQU64581.1 hypothetical protein [Hydrodictyon reticulatum]
MPLLRFFASSLFLPLASASAEPMPPLLRFGSAEAEGRRKVECRGKKEAKQSKAKQSKAKQSKAKQSKAKQSKAKQTRRASTLLLFCFIFLFIFFNSSFALFIWFVLCFCFTCFFETNLELKIQKTQ